MTHKENISQRWLNYFKILVVYHFSMYYVDKKEQWRLSSSKNGEKFKVFAVDWLIQCRLNQWIPLQK